MRSFLHVALTILFSVLAIQSNAQLLPWTTYTNTNSPLPNNVLRAIDRDANGVTYLGINDAGLAVFDGQNWTVFNMSNSALPHNYVYDVTVQSTDTLWLGTEGGLVRMIGTSMTLFTTGNSNIPSNQVLRVIVDEANTIWIATAYAGIARYDGGFSFTSFNKSNSGLPTDSMYNGIDIDNLGNLWIGTNKGLAKFDKVSTWNVYNMGNSSLQNDTIRCVFADNAGTIWMGTGYSGGNGASGLTKFDGFTWTNYTTGNSNITNTYLYDITEDANNNLWIGGQFGLEKFDKSSTWINLPDFPGGGAHDVLVESSGEVHIAGWGGGYLIYDPQYGQCGTASGNSLLNINNVNAGLLTAGDMWWDGVGTAQYEVPAGSGINAFFSGALWVGGIDKTDNNKLKVAARTYRDGNDYWPGPLDAFSDTMAIDTVNCFDFDRHWKVNKSTIDSFIAGQTAGIPLSILEWPGRANPNLSFIGNRHLGPFMDVDYDGNYNPANGDYPLIKGDQAVWWVINDASGYHSESNSEAIGLEVQVMAYGYSTSDARNNTTFYEYKFTNKSTSTLSETYVGFFADPDLGCYTDDFVGCDTTRKLAICYNGDADDASCGVPGYGTDIPMVGITMLQGPKNEFREEIPMSSFVYYNNDASVTGNPFNGNDYYNYMRAIWKDSTQMVEGGNGHISGGGTVPTKYMFPDAPSNGGGWSECSEGNTPGDRRMLISYGPFNLEPNVSNSLTLAAVWVRDSIPYPCPDFSLIQSVVDTIREFFDTTHCDGFTLTVTSAIDAACGIADGSASVRVEGGSPPYFYLWSSGHTTYRADSLEAGIYIINVTDVFGCEQFAAVTISDANGPAVSVSSIVNASCFGSGDGSIDISIVGGTTPYTYAWSTGASSEDIGGLEAGPYEVVVTDAGGCVAAKSVPVAGTSNLAINVSTVNASCGGSNGVASIAVNGGASSYTYAWSSGGTGVIETGLGFGVYTILTTDNNGCIDSAFAAISENGSATIVTDSVSEVTCNGAGGGIYISVTGGSMPYTYTWSNSSTTEDVSGLAAGQYSVTVTDNAGCSAVMVQDLEASIPVIEDICLITVDSILSVNLIVWEKTNTQNIASYNIYKESTQSDVYFKVGSVAATELSEFVDSLSNPFQRAWRYKISAVDSCGQESQLSDNHKTVHLTMNQGITPNTVNLIWNHYVGFPFGTYYIERYTASDGWVVLDSIPGNLTSYSDFAAPTGQILYQIEMRPPSVCVSTKQKNWNSSKSNTSSISLSGPLTATASAIDAAADVCNGVATAAVVDGTPPYTFLWNDPNNQVAQSATGLCPGSYIVIVTDADGNTATASVTVSEQTGIGHQDFLGSINIYPNPTTGALTLEMDVQVEQQIDISITNILGQNVYEATLMGTVGKIKHPIDLQGNSSGIYSLQLTTSRGTSSKNLVLRP